MVTHTVSSLNRDRLHFAHTSSALTPYSITSSTEWISHASSASVSAPATRESLTTLRLFLSSFRILFFPQLPCTASPSGPTPLTPPGWSLVPRKSSHSTTIASHEVWMPWLLRGREHSSFDWPLTLSSNSSSIPNASITTPPP